MPSPTGPSQTTQDKGQDKIRKGAAPRIKRDNDHDQDHNQATHQESRDRDEHRHFHAADSQDIERSQSSARAQKREKGWEDADDGRDDRRDAYDREFRPADRSRYDDDDRGYQRTNSRGGGSGGRHYERVGPGANRRPDYSQDDYLADEPGYRDYRWNGREDRPRQEAQDLQRERDGRNYRDDDRYRFERQRYDADTHRDYGRDRYDLNDRQNGWQANGRGDNRDDRRYNNNWRDDQWRQTAERSRDWRPNDDHRNEQRNGSEYDRDRGSYGNSRFRDDDYGYQSSRRDSRDYGHDNGGRDREAGRNPPRGYSAESERDYDDRNPSRESNRRDHH